MVLHLEEFQNYNPVYGRFLNYYDKLAKYLHEMTVEEIMEHVNRNGTRSWYIQKTIITEYFMWLHKNYGIDLAEKNYQLQKAIKNNENIFIGFYTLEELKQGIEAGMIKATDENASRQPDYSGLKAIFLLEWFGVLPKLAVTIKLTDVSADGKKVYVPAEDKTIEITDSGTADYFAEYKAKTGYKRYKNIDETPYTQDTFYRNTATNHSTITLKTIYNIRDKFVTACEDERFTKKRVYYSGRYAEMLKAEENLGYEFGGLDDKTSEIIKKLFNSEDISYNIMLNILKDYKSFKQGYLELKKSAD